MNFTMIGKKAQKLCERVSSGDRLSKVYDLADEFQPQKVFISEPAGKLINAANNAAQVSYYGIG